MAAGVSSSPRLDLHHPLSSYSQPQSPNTTRRPSLLDTILASSLSSSPSASSPSNSSLLESEPSPGFTTSTASTLSLAASDTSTSANASASASAHDYCRNRLGPNAQTQNSSSNCTSPASTPASSSFPLESVAESAFSPPSASSPTRNRLHPQQQYQQQLGANSARGDLKLHRTGSFFAFAASALDRTQSAISPTSLRHKRSVSRLSISGDSSAGLLRGAESASDNILRHRPASVAVSPSSSVSGFRTLSQEPIYSHPYTETDRSQPAPVILPRVDNKMHQTSSRLLRMTDDDRPFTKVSQLNSLNCDSRDRPLCAQSQSVQ